MYQVVFAAYIILTIILISIILFQKPSNSSLASLSSTSSKYRSDSNFITKATGIIGFVFMVLALTLSVMMKPEKVDISNATQSKSIKTQDIDSA